jgi:hypothetical protein
MICPVPGCRRLPFFVADPCDPSKCARCQREDAGERASIQVEGQPVEAWQAARAAILRERQPGQRALGLR